MVVPLGTSPSCQILQLCEDKESQGIVHKGHMESSLSPVPSLASCFQDRLCPVEMMSGGITFCQNSNSMAFIWLLITPRRWHSRDVCGSCRHPEQLCSRKEGISAWGLVAFGRKHLLRSAPYFRMAFSWVLICEQSKHAGPWETGQRVGCPAVYGTPVTGPAVALKRT